MTCLLKTLVLFGDALLDKAIYVPSGDVVSNHVGSNLSKCWNASIDAFDGAGIRSV